jgi:hypothetical protein
MATKSKTEKSTISSENLDSLLGDDEENVTQTTLRVEGSGNGATETRHIGHSSQPAEWEIAEREAEQRAIQSPDNTAIEEEPFETLTPEEAEEVLGFLVQYDGRLPIKVRRRRRESNTYYVRIPTGKIRMDAEYAFQRSIHQCRKDGIKTTAEMVGGVLDSLPAEDRVKVKEIENNQEITAAERHIALMNMFMNRSEFSMIQFAADVYAQKIQHAILASTCVQRYVEVEDDKKWGPVWKTYEDFLEEDSDVTDAIVLDMLEAHRKLQSARFLPTSSENPEPGPTNENSPKSTD